MILNRYFKFNFHNESLARPFNLFSPLSLFSSFLFFFFLVLQTMSQLRLEEDLAEEQHNAGLAYVPESEVSLVRLGSVSGHGVAAPSRSMSNSGILEFFDPPKKNRKKRKKKEKSSCDAFSFLKSPLCLNPCLFLFVFCLFLFCFVLVTARAECC
jgi:hypothetical protein